jgi:uncharacterized Zn ribbon protein
MKMSTTQRAAARKTVVKKLKLNRETIKDLDAKGKGSQIKGGASIAQTMTNPARPKCYAG